MKIDTSLINGTANNSMAGNFGGKVVGVFLQIVFQISRFVM